MIRSLRSTFSYISSCSTTRSLRSSLRTAALGQQGGRGTSSHTSRGRGLVARIKGTMFHPITEVKARKRKASPDVIDLTRSTQKRPRSASGNDIIALDEDPKASTPAMVGGGSGPGRSPSVEIQDELSLTKGDVMKHVLNWSRLTMKTIRSESAGPPIEYQLNFVRRQKDKYQILYFPLTAPLTDAEKSQRKVVTSLKL